MGAGVEAEGAPGALRGQIENGGGTGADPVCGGTGFEAGVGTAASGARVGIVDGWLGWTPGLGAAIGGVGAGAETWRGWAGVAGGAER